ncbi:MAG: cyclase family protein [Nitrospira sp.]|nr:cyclase family protein [Nitrospira sp.]
MPNGSGGWIDITVPLRDGMVRWPDNPPVRVTRVQDLDRGDDCNLTEVSFGVHTGTHMDAPLHFIRTGQGMEAMPIEAAMGPARVIEIEDRELIKPDELRLHRIRQGERVLFKTRNSSRCWQTDTFCKDFVSISEEAAFWLAERRVRTVGIDYLSVAGYGSDTVAIHRALLEAGIWIIEGLNLSCVRAGSYELLCLPIKIARSDGAPARALVKPLRTRRTKQTG